VIVISELCCSVILSQWLSQELQLFDPQSVVLDLQLLDLNAFARSFVEAMPAAMVLPSREVICGGKLAFLALWDMFY
jgi:hypothetical protein